MHLCPPIVQVRLAALFRKVNQLPGRYAYNWRDNEVSLVTYLDALSRHVAKLLDGEWIDPDTGESHITMIMGNCAIISDAELHGTLVKDLPEAGGRLSALMADYSAQYKAELPDGVVRFEDGKDCGDPDCKAAECLATRVERMTAINDVLGLIVDEPVQDDDTEEPRERPHEIVSLDDEVSTNYD